MVGSIEGICFAPADGRPQRRRGEGGCWKRERDFYSAACVSDCACVWCRWIDAMQLSHTHIFSVIRYTSLYVWNINTSVINESRTWVYIIKTKLQKMPPLTHIRPTTEHHTDRKKCPSSLFRMYYSCSICSDDGGGDSGGSGSDNALCCSKRQTPHIILMRFGIFVTHRIFFRMCDVHKSPSLSKKIWWRTS